MFHVSLAHFYLWLSPAPFLLPVFDFHIFWLLGNCGHLPLPWCPLPFPFFFMQALAFNYKANLTFLIVVMQCVVGTILVEIGRRLGYASYDPFNLATARRWLPVSLCFSAMLFTSFKALELMNVPMVSKFACDVYDTCKKQTAWLMGWGGVH